MSKKQSEIEASQAGVNYFGKISRSQPAYSAAAFHRTVESRCGLLIYFIYTDKFVIFETIMIRAGYLIEISNVALSTMLILLNKAFIGIHNLRAFC